MAKGSANMEHDHETHGAPLPQDEIYQTKKALGLPLEPFYLPDEVIDFFKGQNFSISSNSYFDIASDIDIGKVDPDYLYEVLSKMELQDAEALFISCTALPALSIIDKLEKKIGKYVLSSNQTLIWDTLEKIGKNKSIQGFGKLFQ